MAMKSTVTSSSPPKKRRDTTDSAIRARRQALPGRVRAWIMGLVSDHMHTRLRYYRAFKRFPNLRRPRTFNEKICYRKLNPQPAYTTLSDKVAVRDYVAQKIGAQYLIPCHGVTQKLTPEMYEALPAQFVMKGNHGSGYNLLVHNKSDHGFAELAATGHHWLGQDFYRESREIHYQPIVAQLMFEALLFDEAGKVPRDFKFHCFRGSDGARVVYIEVIQDRFTNYRESLYTRDWQPIATDGEATGPAAPRPPQLEKAVALALELAEDFSYVRVDFYLPGESIYFGELTFTPDAGFMRFHHPETDRHWGTLFDV